MEFREALNQLAGCVSSEDVAAEIGCATITVMKARGPKADRPPPRGWEAAIARIARRLSGDFASLAATLERQASD